MNQISINIITALNCEAKPLIDFYRLAKQRSKPFDLYTGTASFSGDEREFNINIIVAGIGQINTSTACGWLASEVDADKAVWLNIGIAGHKEYSVGDIVRVCQVVDPVSSYSHFPSLTAKWPRLNSALLTSATPSREYPENAMVDMEGAAFFRAAGLFASSELVQSLKVVSDNDEVSVDRLNAAIISELIHVRVADIDGFIKSIAQLLPLRDKANIPSELISHLHCTVSQRQQFTELIERLTSLQAYSNEIEDEISQANSMKSVLAKLNQSLDSLIPSLDEMVS